MPSKNMSTICRRPDLALDVYCCRLKTPKKWENKNKKVMEGFAEIRITEGI